MSKKPFAETGFGKFLQKAKPIVGKGLEIVGELTGKEAIENIGELLQDKKDESPEHAALAAEFEKYKLQWEMEMQQLEVEQLRIELADVQNARAMRNEFTKQGKHDWLMYAVAAFLLFVVGYMVYVGLNSELTDKQYEIYCRLEGILIGGALMMLFSFLWGTTRGSQRKTDAMERMIPKK